MKPQFFLFNGWWLISVDTWHIAVLPAKIACLNIQFSTFWYTLSIRDLHQTNRILSICTTHWDQLKKKLLWPHNSDAVLDRWCLQLITSEQQPCGSCRDGTLFCVALIWCSSTCRAAVPIWFTYCSESQAFVAINQLHLPGDIGVLNILWKLLTKYKNHIEIE